MFSNEIRSGKEFHHGPPKHHRGPQFFYFLLVDLGNITWKMDCYMGNITWQRKNYMENIFSTGVHIDPRAHVDPD